MKEIALIVPTIREKCMLDFYKRWDAVGLFDRVDLYVMEDNQRPTFEIMTGRPYGPRHLSWDNIEAQLKELSWIIPRRSDTVRSYAYYFAWKMGYKYIMTLDDDCYPCTEEDGITYDGAGFVDEHLKWLDGRTRWFNTLSQVTPRGVPYFNRGKNERILVNHGLWTNVLDYDAPRQLAAPAPEKFAFDNRIVPPGSYFPMCGMNLMWKAEATVLMYHLLMGHVVGWNSWRFTRTKNDVKDHNGSSRSLFKLPFDRFGDIWCGIIMKKILDLTGNAASTGLPYIRHERASNPFTNLRKEANGLEVNEKFWEHVDAFYTDPNRSFHVIYSEMGAHVSTYAEFPEHVEYFQALGTAMQAWAEMFT